MPLNLRWYEGRSYFLLKDFRPGSIDKKNMIAPPKTFIIKRKKYDEKTKKIFS